MFNLIALLFKEYIQESKRMKKLRKRQWFLANRKTINLVERKYQFGIDHYGKVLPGKQEQLKKKIKSRLNLSTTKNLEFRGYDITPRTYESGTIKVKPRYRYRLKLHWRRETIPGTFKRINVPYYQ